MKFSIGLALAVLPVLAAGQSADVIYANGDILTGAALMESTPQRVNAVAVRPLRQKPSTVFDDPAHASRAFAWH